MYEILCHLFDVLLTQWRESFSLDIRRDSLPSASPTHAGCYVPAEVLASSSKPSSTLMARGGGRPSIWCMSCHWRMRKVLQLVV